MCADAAVSSEALSLALRDRVAMALRSPLASVALRAAPRAAPRRLIIAAARNKRITRVGHRCASRLAARRCMRAHAPVSHSKPWTYHDDGVTDYDELPAQERFGHVVQGENGEEAADEPAAPLVLSPGHLYRDSHHSIDAMVSALEAERNALLLLKQDGWEADAWNTEEFAALRPGARSRWRVSNGAAAGRRGISLLVRSRTPDGAAGSIEFADGPHERH